MEMDKRKNNWELSYEDFCRCTKTIRLPEYYDDYFRLGKTHLRCYRFLIYIDNELNVVNPSTKKDKDKIIIYKYCSTTSREDCLSKAFLFIVKHALDNGLLQEPICTNDTIKKQIDWLNTNSK